MNIFLLSQSDAFRRHIQSMGVGEHDIQYVHSVSDDLFKQQQQPAIFLLHASSYKKNLTGLIEKIRNQDKHAAIAIATDLPELGEMLALARFRINAYFNSYMADIHYQQMFRLLETGQTWFSPDLLARALELAGRATTQGLTTDEISRLTRREKDVTRAVARGLSNKEIAAYLNISERTVKTHLTHIFEKLDIKDRTTLAIRLNATINTSPQQSVG